MQVLFFSLYGTSGFLICHVHYAFVTVHRLVFRENEELIRFRR